MIIRTQRLSGDICHLSLAPTVAVLFKEIQNALVVSKVQVLVIGKKILFQSQLASVIRRLDLAAALRGLDPGGNWANECQDLMAAVREYLTQNVILGYTTEDK